MLGSKSYSFLTSTWKSFKMLRNIEKQNKKEKEKSPKILWEWKQISVKKIASEHLRSACFGGAMKCEKEHLFWDFFRNSSFMSERSLVVLNNKLTGKKIYHAWPISSQGCCTKSEPGRVSQRKSACRDHCTKCWSCLTFGDKIWIYTHLTFLSFTRAISLILCVLIVVIRGFCLLPPFCKHSFQFSVQASFQELCVDIHLPKGIKPCDSNSYELPLFFASLLTLLMELFPSW